MNRMILLVGLLTTINISSAESLWSGDLQVSLQSIYFDATAELSNYSLPSRETDTAIVHLEAKGVTVNYAFNGNVSFGGGLYLIDECGIDESPVAMTCALTEAIRGTHLNLLVGHNLNADGVYVYSGVRYYWEQNSQAEFGTLTVPVGIGFRFLDVSADVTLDLRDFYTDYEYFDIFEPTDSDWFINNEYGEGAITAIPVYFSLGYKF